jgi:hypothetical protein
MDSPRRHTSSPQLSRAPAPPDPAPACPDLHTGSAGPHVSSRQSVAAAQETAEAYRIEGCGPVYLCQVQTLRVISQSWPSSRLAPKSTGEDHSPGSALAQQATRRPQAAAPLTVILTGSRLERREGGRSRAGAAGGRTAASRRRAVPGVTHGRPPAVCRRCKGGSGQPGDVRCPRALAPAPAERAHRHLARQAYLARDHAPDGARRAARALERRIESPHGHGTLVT